MSNAPRNKGRRLSDLLDGYYAWLVAKLELGEEVVKFPRGIYDISSMGMILFQLHEIEFSSPIEADANRAQDGLALRDEYWNLVMDQADPQGPLYPFFQRQASCLEVIIGLCIRMDFIKQKSIGEYFKALVLNLDLQTVDVDHNERTIKKWLVRDIKPNGEGGLFPMNWNQEDQRGLELWYQMQQYLAERKR